MIRAIAFDGNGVLYYRTSDFTDALIHYIHETYMPNLNLEHAVALQLKFMHEAFDNLISKEDALTRFMNSIGLQDPEARRDILSKELEFSKDIHLFPGERETLLELSLRGFRLGMITNSYQSASEKASWFRALGLDCIAENIVSSIDVGVSKPDSRIYLEFANRVCFEPKEIAFVGHEEAELQGARIAGMLPISFNCKEDIRQRLHLQEFSDLLYLF